MLLINKHLYVKYWLIYFVWPSDLLIYSSVLVSLLLSTSLILYSMLNFCIPYLVSISRLILPRVQLILPLVVHKPCPLLIMHTRTFYSFQRGIMHVGWANTQCSTRTWLGFMLLRITTILEITVGSNNHPWSQSLTSILNECDFWSIDKHLSDLLTCCIYFFISLFL